MTDAPYLAEVQAALPRLLALYDTDPVSPTRGLGDRAYWGWKTSDFANAVYQGAANGLARLLVYGLLPPDIGEASVLGRIRDMIAAVARITDRDGSLAEAYPHESSFCVAAGVLFDGLLARDLLGSRLDAATRAHWLEILAPLARFLGRGDETHGFIANHLATAAAALFRWNTETGESLPRARALLDRILAAQSDEGWFPEYGYADPGYQTLCLHYLADLHLARPDLGLAAPLERCLRFLSYCAHPDGSFGGLYGWRGTRFCAPSAFEALAPEMPDAARLAAFARASLAQRSTVPLAAFDDPNLPVMFNVWAWAAALAPRAPALRPDGALPCAGPHEWRRHFGKAGLLIDKGATHYTVIGWRKGGVVQHYVDGRHARTDPGALYRRSDGVLAASQSILDAAAIEEAADAVLVRAPLVTTTSRPPTPAQFALLRLLSISLLRLKPLNEGFKRLLVRRIVTGARRTGLTLRRRITLGRDLRITDAIEDDAAGWTAVRPERPFNTVHMASRGYWQRQDDADAAP